MNKFLITAVLFCSLLTLSSQTKTDKNKIPETVTFVEEVKDDAGDGVTIPYKRYKLVNGLNIVIHEDHSDPICYVDITYHVGSSREQQGRSGFAHFFEHMMF